jgi:gamma-glutamyl-gamma-aminobutyrate hydrolase PuuD
LPVALPQPVEAIDPVLEAVDAIVLAPGRDIDPLRYGQESHSLLAATGSRRPG